MSSQFLPAESETARSPLPSAKPLREGEPSRGNWSHLEIHSARHDWVELSLPCVIEAADQFSEFSVWFFAELKEETREALRTAMRELVLNAIEWGGKLDETQKVRVAILRGQESVLCRIADPGNGFRWDELGHASICNPSDDPCKHLLVREQRGLRAGGFGLAIVQGSIDELIYNATGNEVVFVKYLKRFDPSARIARS
jgi:anti-sigma regulatory factor (Ser/Thr protein kinase)